MWSRTQTRHGLFLIGWCAKNLPQWPSEGWSYAVYTVSEQNVLKKVKVRANDFIYAWSFFSLAVYICSCIRKGDVRYETSCKDNEKGHEPICITHSTLCVARFIFTIISNTKTYTTLITFITCGCWLRLYRYGNLSKPAFICPILFSSFTNWSLFVLIL